MSPREDAHLDCELRLPANHPLQPLLTLTFEQLLLERVANRTEQQSVAKVARDEANLLDALSVEGRRRHEGGGRRWEAVKTASRHGDTEGWQAFQQCYG